MNMKFKKTELITILKKNRDQHREIFEEACEGYQKRMIAHLQTMLNDVKRRASVSHHIGMSIPIDQTPDYDRAIRMLDMCVDDVIELNEQTFANYVMDDWNWTNNFLASNTRYSKKAVEYSKTKSSEDW